MRYILLLLILSGLFSCTRSRVAYIDVKAAFDGFVYKQQLEKELRAISSYRKRFLDSLDIELKILSKKIDLDKQNKELVAEYHGIKKLLLDKHSVFAEEEEMMVRQSDEKILLQLNTYVKEYGKNEGYAIIYGANNSGNVMYGDSSLDITKAVIVYVNTRFNGSR